jgi:hypothetical protein
MTLPEREGWIDREQLFDFTGRSRKPQMALAKEYGLKDYSQPAGGSLPHHFTGNNKIEVIFRNPLLGFIHHKDLAVQAGIHIGTVPMLRINQDIFILFNNIDDMQLDPQC